MRTGDVVLYGEAEATVLFVEASGGVLCLDVDGVTVRNVPPDQWRPVEPEPVDDGEPAEGEAPKRGRRKA